MKQKDITEKLLEDYEDVFADIVNVLLFGGKNVVLPEALDDAKAKSQYKADDAVLHEMERDVVKLWKDKNTHIALYGIENQTKAEKDMPLRILGYDGSCYRSQLLKNTLGERYPVVTIVLYFGWESHWSEPKTLKKVLRVPAELEAYVNDYRVHVFEIAWLSDEQVTQFQSDFRIVAEFFTQMRKSKDYKPSARQIKHVDAVLKMLSVFGQTEEFEQLVVSGKSKEVKNMCEAIDKIVNKGRIQGLEEGIRQGREEGREIGLEIGLKEGKEIGREEGKEIGREEGKEIGREEGKEIGREEGIKVLVKTLKELKQENEIIIEKLIENFLMSEEEARKYI